VWGLLILVVIWVVVGPIFALVSALRANRRAGEILRRLENLERQAGIDPAEAARRLERYRHLRDLIRAMTTELTSSGELSRSRVRELNHVLRQGLHYHQLEMSPDGNQYGLARVGDRLDQARAAVAGTFAEFLAGPDVGRLRICANEGCREIFIDRSPTGRRRWCTMRTCGNRAKAARHRDRYRGTVLPPQPGPVRPLPASAPAH